MTGTSTPTAATLAARLADVSIADERRLGRRLSGLRSIRDTGKRDKALADLADQVARAELKLTRRLEALPAISFPPELPVADRADDLAAAIAANQVVIVAGETGSGKSTQLPKICLKLGRGTRGMIGHTQPRRIAARALAERIAEETGTEVGGAIGYAIRFGDHTGPQTLVKLMTDGILLAEIGRDRLLTAYDTIVIDEAHERSLNIDFLLGYLTELLPQRPDLKVIITSATIDPERFSQHFGGAPIVEVSGRTYPVEIRYRPYGVPESGDPDDDAAQVAEQGKRAKGGKAGVSTAAREETDQATAITQAVDELCAEGDGDILIFLSGEREITDTAEVLRGHLAYRPGQVEVLPLYGRLSAADQHRVFSAHSGRRIVLSTNVAETSLTVPGIRYVIDPGTARISRYSVRTKVQRLPIEKISQASAGQRAGRCGRVADGICIRLYDEEDFLSRPEFTDPEIARTSLASVILQMAALGLGDIASFPFVEPPDPRQITDGVTVLDELGALDRSGADNHVRLTPVGRSLAALPVDPRLARMIVEGDRLGCLPDILVITAAMAIQDVREFPLEERDRATASHSRFADPNSDFLALLNLWRYLAEEANARSGNAFRRMCRTEYLHYLRVREWQDLHAQLRQIARGLGMAVDGKPAGTSELQAGAAGLLEGQSGDGRRGKGPREIRDDEPRRNDERRGNGKRGKQRGIGSSAFSAAKHAKAVAAQQQGQPEVPAVSTAGSGKTSPAPEKTGPVKGSHAVAVDFERIHTALLAGLLSHVGSKIEPSREYQGARGSKFTLWPGSALAKSGPKFVMAAELVETSRLWGRVAARIDPIWAERVGAHLVKRSHSEPRWDARRGAVVATERVTLLGVTLVAARTVQFDRIDPVLSRELFIRHALVEADWETRHAFFAANQAALDEVAEREDRARRRDIVIDDDTLFALYDARIPADVTSGRHLDSWWRKASRATPDLLTFTPDMLIAAGAQDVSAEAYPDSFTSGGVDLDLDYVFDPSREDDGVTVTIPLAVLARVDPAAFQAQIPGLRSDLAVALLRSLPKTLRRNFVPAPDFAAAALSRLSPDAATASLPEALAAELTALTGIVLKAADFDLEKIPDHLRMTFRVVDDSGKSVATGKNLGALQDELRGDTRQAVAKVAGGVERRGLTAFPAQGIPREIASTVDGHQVLAYPALVDERSTVGVSVFTSAADQARAMRAGTRRLLVLGARSPLSYLKYQLSKQQLMTLSTAPHGSLGALVDDAVEAAIDALLDWAGGVAWEAKAFEKVAAKISPHLDKATLDVLTAGEKAMRSAHQAQSAIEAVQGSAVVAQAADMRLELATLMRPGFLTATKAAHLPDLDRYLQALAVRATRVRENPDRDRQRMEEILALTGELEAVVATMRPEQRDDEQVRAVRRMVAEHRIALFAQPMKAAIPVSAKRIRAALSELTP